MTEKTALSTQIRTIKVVSLAEGTTLLLLVAIAVPLKYAYGWPQAVQAMGPIHGLAFLCYLWIVVQAATEGDWRKADAIRAIVLAFVPFGAFANARFMARRMSERRTEAAR
jgi:integral membrane protein